MDPLVVTIPLSREEGMVEPDLCSAQKYMYQDTLSRHTNTLSRDRGSLIDSLAAASGYIAAEKYQYQQLHWHWCSRNKINTT